MIIYQDFDYVFDEVQFGIDVRAERLKRALSQETLATAVGYSTGSAISQIERGRIVNAGLPMRTYVGLCNILDLKPGQYFDVQRADAFGSDMLQNGD